MKNSKLTVSSLLVVAVAMATTAGATHFVGEQAAPCLNLRAAPGGAALSCLAPGAEVQVVESRGDWGRVRLATGDRGWMALAYLTPGKGGVSGGRQELLATTGSGNRSAETQATLVQEAPIEIRATVVQGGLIYDQTDSPAGAGFNSQVYDAASATFDCRAGDDFTVPAADLQWNVAGAVAVGAYINGPGPTSALNVEFFADGGGVPGAPVCSYPGLLPGPDYTDNGAGTFTIVLPSVCLLPAGDYWLSVQAVMDSTMGGQWLWAERAAATGANFAWENPPDGFGTGCVSWTPAGACGASAPDLLYSLSGAIVPVELQSISID